MILFNFSHLKSDISVYMKISVWVYTVNIELKWWNPLGSISDHSIPQEPVTTKLHVFYGLTELVDESQKYVLIGSD